MGYRVTRQTGSHMRLTIEAPTQHHVTVPKHDALRLGMLSSILEEVAAHLEITRDDLISRLFD
jgi:predicted RNA binding protein YcfA (HicA-like mRNA interferase family)